MRSYEPVIDHPQQVGYCFNYNDESLTKQRIQQEATIANEVRAIFEKK